MSSAETPGPYDSDPRFEGRSTYDRQECIDVICEFLHYLCDRLPYLQREWILEPPIGGWPDLPQILGPLERTEEAIQLLAHMPYVRVPCKVNIPEPCELGWPCIKRYTHLINYQDETYHAAIAKESGGYKNLSDDFKLKYEVFNRTVPPWVVCLSVGLKYGEYLLLDTSDGTITSLRAELGDDNPDYPEDDPRRWRDDGSIVTLPIQEYFDQTKDEIESLKWIPCFEGGQPVMLWQVEYPVGAPRLVSIYHQHGWPDNFRRDACREALLDFDKNGPGLYR